MTTKEGVITWELFKVTGNIKLIVRYTLLLDDEGNPKVSDMTVESEEETEELDQEQVEEILEACLEDAKTKEPKQEEKKSYLLSMGDYDFGLN